MPKLKTVEDFYEYMGQCNMYKPKFQDLSDKCKAHWLSEFKKYLEARHA